MPHSAAKIRVLLVDDHVMMRAGLRALLELNKQFEVVGEAGEGRTSLRLVDELKPHVVVMDLRMPDLNGIEATRQLVHTNRGIKVIGLSANSDRQSVIEMLRAGAVGYVLKESAFEELSLAISSIMNNKVFLSPSIANIISDETGTRGGAPSAYSQLSPRERELLQLIAEGKATKEAALCLHVSVKTIETHRRNLMEKLQIDNVAELTKYALREGLTSL